MREDTATRQPNTAVPESSPMRRIRPVPIVVNLWRGVYMERRQNRGSVRDQTQTGLRPAGVGRRPALPRGTAVASRPLEGSPAADRLAEGRCPQHRTPAVVRPRSGQVARVPDPLLPRARSASRRVAPAARGGTTRHSDARVQLTRHESQQRGGSERLPGDTSDRHHEGPAPQPFVRSGVRIARYACTGETTDTNGRRGTGRKSLKRLVGMTGFEPATPSTPC